MTYTIFLICILASAAFFIGGYKAGKQAGRVEVYKKIQNKLAKKIDTGFDEEIRKIHMQLFDIRKKVSK